MLRQEIGIFLAFNNTMQCILCSVTKSAFSLFLIAMYKMFRREIGILLPFDNNTMHCMICSAVRSAFLSGFKNNTMRYIIRSAMK